MPRIVMIVALMTGGYYAYTEYYRPGGHGFATTRGSGFSSGAGVAKSIAGGAAAAAAKIAR